MVPHRRLHQQWFTVSRRTNLRRNKKSHPPTQPRVRKSQVRNKATKALQQKDSRGSQILLHAPSPQTDGPRDTRSRGSSPWTDHPRHNQRSWGNHPKSGSPPSPVRSPSLGVLSVPSTSPTVFSCVLCETSLRKQFLRSLKILVRGYILNGDWGTKRGRNYFRKIISQSNYYLFLLKSHVVHPDRSCSVCACFDETS